MKNPLQKPVKWAKNNPLLTGVIFISVLVLAWVVYLYTTKQTTTATDKTASPAKYRIPGKRTFSPTKVYKMIMLVDAQNWAKRMQVISAGGFDTIQLVVPIGETYTSFDKHIEYANVAVNAGLNVVLKPWIIFTGAQLNADFPASEMQQNSAGSKLYDNRYHLSLSSSKWSKVYEWARRFKAAFQPFYDAGYVIACFPANQGTQEWGYQYAFGGDFSNPETAASGGINKSATGSLQYHRFMVQNLKTRLAGIAAIFTGWRVGLDCGSFYYGFHKYGGTFDYNTISNHPNIKWLKNNPIIGTAKDFDAALQYDWKKARVGYYCTEWTNADGATADALAIHHRNTINEGGNLCSFAFHTPDANGGGAAWALAKQVRQMLLDSGDWNKPVSAPVRVGRLDYSLERIFNENGFENGIRQQFESMLTNGIPDVRCTS